MRLFALIICSFVSILPACETNGKIVLDGWDRVEPLTPDSAKQIGLWAYGTDMISENLAIHTGTPNPKTRPVNKSKEK